MKKEIENEVLTSKENAKGVEKERVCSICGKPFKGMGNNPKPLKFKGRCCDECDEEVLKARKKLYKEISKAVENAFIGFIFIDGVTWYEMEKLDSLVPNKINEVSEYQNFHEASEFGLYIKQKRVITSFSIDKIKKKQTKITCKAYFELRNNGGYDVGEVLMNLRSWFDGESLGRLKNTNLMVLCAEQNKADKGRSVFRLAFSAEFV